MSDPAGDDLPLEPWARVGRDRRYDPRPVRSSVAVSFGSQAQDDGSGRLDLNDILIRNPQASFLMRAGTDAMREAGIEHDDLLVVDRAVEAQHGHVVIAVVGDGFVCRRLACRDGLALCATDPTVADIVPRDGEELRIWGVVTTIVKSLPV